MRKTTAAPFALSMIAATLLLASACSGPEREASRATVEPAASERTETTAATAPALRTGSIGACDLLSAADLEAITGDQFAQGQPTSSDPRMSRCGWVPTDGVKGGVSLTVHEAPEQETWQNYVGRPGSTPLEGLGDAAILNLDLLDVVVRKGGKVAVIHFARPEDREHVADWGTEVAQRVLPKL